MGYMGSGKSTLGCLLADQYNCQFIDLDQYIEEQEKASIVDIFKLKGEIYFRKKEHQYLNEILAKKNPIILALGGGTPCFAGNIELLKVSEAALIYLKLTIPAIVGRLKSEQEQRPLISHLKTDEQLIEFVGKHLFERSFYYNQATHIIVISETTIAQAINKIKAVLA